jgi:hypothetical protein
VRPNDRFPIVIRHACKRLDSLLGRATLDDAKRR